MPTTAHCHPVSHGPPRLVPFVPSPAEVAREAAVDACFRGYQLDHSAATQAHLLELTSWLSERCARKFAHRGEPFDDLAQVAAIGLLKAIERFDPARGVAFGAFATPTIMGELRRHFRDRTWSVYVPRRAKDLRGLVGATSEQLGVTLQRSASVAEIAVHLSLSQQQVAEVLQSNLARTTATLDGTTGGALQLPADISGLAQYDNVLDQQMVDGLLGGLPARNRRVVELRYFDRLSQSDIAAIVGLSQVHVGRLLAASLASLRMDAQQEQFSAA